MVKVIKRERIKITRSLDREMYENFSREAWYMGVKQSHLLDTILRERYEDHKFDPIPLQPGEKDNDPWRLKDLNQ